MMPPSMNSNMNDDDLDIYGFFELVKSIPSQIFSPSVFQLMIWKCFLTCFITTFYFFCNHIVTRNNICFCLFLLFASLFCVVGIFNERTEKYFIEVFLWVCSAIFFGISFVLFTMYAIVKEHFWDALIIISRQFAMQKEKKHKTK